MKRYPALSESLHTRRLEWGLADAQARGGMDILQRERPKHRAEGPRHALGPSQEEGLFEGEVGAGGALEEMGEIGPHFIDFAG